MQNSQQKQFKLQKGVRFEYIQLKCWSFFPHNLIIFKQRWTLLLMCLMLMNSRGNWDYGQFLWTAGYSTFKFQIFFHFCIVTRVLTSYDKNHYFGLGRILKVKPKLADSFGWYSNRYQNHTFWRENLVSDSKKYHF